MNWIDIIGMVMCVGYLGALLYGWLHQHEPFWNGFCDPFRLGD